MVSPPALSVVSTANTGLRTVPKVGPNSKGFHLSDAGDQDTVQDQVQVAQLGVIEQDFRIYIVGEDMHIEDDREDGT